MACDSRSAVVHEDRRGPRELAPATLPRRVCVALGLIVAAKRAVRTKCAFYQHPAQRLSLHRGAGDHIWTAVYGAAVHMTTA